MSMNIKNGTSFLPPFSVLIDLEKGRLPEARNHIVRRASAMRGHYEDANALERLIRDHDDPVHYEVFETSVPQEYGQLMTCISVLRPGVVGSECFMTKGHYHTVLETGEIYLCLRGEGCMIMKTQEGGFASEPMSRGRMVYVPPYWAHRSVNTGGEDLVSFCVYPADAGHNYGDIEEEGFPRRVYRKNRRVEVR